MKSTYCFVMLVAWCSLMVTACREKQSESPTTPEQQSATTGQAEPKSAPNEPISKQANGAAKDPVKVAPPDTAVDSAKPSEKTDPNDSGIRSTAQPAETATTPEVTNAPPTSSTAKDKTAVIEQPAGAQEATETTSEAPGAVTVKRKTPRRITATIPGSLPGLPLADDPEEYSRRFPATERGLTNLLAYFVQDGVDMIEASRLLRPYKKDYPAVFLDDFAERAELYYETVWSSDTFAIAGFMPGAKYTISQVTTQELRQRTGDVAPKWPQGYDLVIQYFNEDMTLYRVMLQSPISTLISPADFFVHVNGHWTMFARPYWVLRFTSP